MSDASGVCLARDDLGTLRVTGQDAQSWLQGLATNDVLSLEVGGGGWGLFLTKPGKIITDALFVRTDDAVIVGVPRGRLEVLLDHLDAFLVMEDAEVDVEEGSWLTVHGPRALDAAREALGSGSGVVVAGLDWPDGAGAVAVGHAEDIAELAGALDRRGFSPPTDPRRFRIEAFLPEYGVDYDERQNPHEASLERVVVDWDKGCYLGQEAVCMLDMRGKVKRRLVTLAVDGESPAVGDEVSVGADVVGAVTSSAGGSSPGLAFARVAAKFAEPGVVLSVGGAEARVVRGAPKEVTRA